MFCKICGSYVDENEQKCPGCSADTSTETKENTSAAETGTPATETIVPVSDENFMQFILPYAKDPLFFAGISLFTIGGTLTVLPNLSIFSLITLLPVITILAIAGMWFIYTAEKKPENFISAMGFFKVAAVMEIVIFSLMAGFVLLLIFLDAVIGSLSNRIENAFSFPLFLLAMAIVAAIIYYYYVPMLRIINGLRNRAEQNDSAPVRGFKPFIIMSWMRVGFTLLTMFIALFFWERLGTMMTDALEFAYGEEGFFDAFGEMSFRPAPLSVFTALATNSGMICLILVLNKLKKGLEQKQEPV
ncbi:MAG: hypothetical protein FWF79_03930 [Defluviitaleaceae bacterium]|nr:hypothetical protein [Defluviitaleaceae bacterium]